MLPKKISLAPADKVGIEFLITKIESNSKWAMCTDPAPPHADLIFDKFLSLMFHDNKELKSLIGNNHSLEELKDIRAKAVVAIQK